MRQRLLTMVSLLLMTTVAARAQWDVQFSDYTALKSFYNPAVSGTEGKLNVAAAYSMQMVGYKGAPQTMYAGADCPVYFLTPRHGAGLSLFSDNIGMFSTMRISLQYAYNVRLGKKARLAAGIQAALLTEKVDPSKVKLEDQSDPAFPTSSVNGKSFDMGVGMYYYHPWVWAGLSVQHVLAPTVKLSETNEVSIPRMYYLMVGGNIKLKNSPISLSPSAMLQTDLTSWREDVQCKVNFELNEKKFYFGLGYSPSTSTTFLLGGVFHGISLGYSYQLYTSGIGSLNGSHEIVLGYQTDLDLFKKGRNLHKSVRWL